MTHAKMEILHHRASPTATIHFRSELMITYIGYVSEEFRLFYTLISFNHMVGWSEMPGISGEQLFYICCVQNLNQFAVLQTRNTAIESAFVRWRFAVLANQKSNGVVYREIFKQR